MRGDAIQKPAVVADDDGAAWLGGVRHHLGRMAEFAFYLPFLLG